MKLLITGSRGWNDEVAIEAVIKNYRHTSQLLDKPFTLIHGHAKSGADALADRVGRLLGLEPGRDLIREPADWKRYGRSAGPIRNQKMLDDHQPDVVVAFRSTGKSNGTDDMITRARKAGVIVHVLSEGDHLPDVRPRDYRDDAEAIGNSTGFGGPLPWRSHE